MTTRKILYIIICLVLGTAGVMAQTDVQLTQYYAAPTVYNPGAVGDTDYLRIRGGGRMQWLGVDNAPKTFLGAADMPFKFIGRRFGTGILIQQESAGLYRTLMLDAQLGFKFRRLGGEWTVGLQVGMYDQAFKGSEVYIPDGDDYHQSGDEAIPTSDIHGTALDLGAGLWYAHRYFSAGVSCTHLTSPKITLNGDAEGGGSETSTGRKYQFEARRTFYFMALGNIPVKNTLFELLPSVMVKSDLTFTTAEVMARARYNRFLSFGIGYRYNDALLATVAAEIKNFYLGYSYDYSTGAIGRASAGSHEVFVGYSLKLDFSEKNRNRHKSIRIM